MGRPLRVLLVEDNEDDALLVTEELARGGFDVSWERVETREGMAEALNRGPWDLILSDFRMPRFSGPEAVALRRDLGIDTPIIIVSGTVGEEQAVQALRAGAHDFFVKGRLTRLCPGVERELREAENRRARRKAEEEREASRQDLVRKEELLRQVIDVNPNFIFVKDREGRFTLANRAVAEAYGTTVEALIGKTDSDFNMNAEETAAFQRDDIEVIEGGHQKVIPEESITDARGIRRWFQTTKRPLADADGRTGHVLGVATDITERRRAEEALRTSEERFAQLVECAPDAMVIANAAGEIVLINAQTERLFGYRPEDLLGRSMESLVPERCRGRYAERRWTCATDPRMRSMDAGGDLHGLRKDGTEFPAEISLSPLETKEGRLISSAIRDVTDRMRSQVELERAQRFVRRIVDSIPGIVYIYDEREKRVVFSNKELTNILGYAHGEVEAMGSSFIERLVHPEDAAGVREQHKTHVAAGDDRHHEFEYRIRHSDGEWRRLRSRQVVFERADREVRQVLGVAVDVTEAHRTEQLLVQAQKVEAIGRLAGGVAHDFNNILGVITGYGELALRELEAKHRVRRRIDQMLKAAERAAGLTRQLLAFGRKQVMQPKVVDLRAIVVDIDKMLRRLIGEDVDLVVHSAGEGCVKADPSQLEQIILNLAVNARDAMAKGGRLTIETADVDLDDEYATAHPTVDAGRYVMLAVSDTGTGMDKETQLRIFEPFFTTKAEGQGTGLGLATVHGIVKQSGGHIWVYSEPGRGTSFKVYLPLVEDAAKAPLPTPPTQEADGGNEVVLLVEDTEPLREVIRETLEDRGYTVLSAANGEEALTLAHEQQGPIDLLLTDVVMPRLGGGDLATVLSALRPKMRIVYMSGYSNGAISHHGVLGEGVRLLEKPFTAGKLAWAVRQALDEPERPA